MMHRIRAAMRDDSGIAMLVVVGVMSIVTVLAVSSFVLARQALHDSERVEGASRAFRVASSALEAKIATLDEVALAELVAAGTAGIGGSSSDGTYTLFIDDLGRSEYELRSEGKGVDGTIETVRQRFFHFDLWRMNMSAGEDGESDIGGGNTLQGSSYIVGPFYVKGQLSVDANMSVYEGPLFVKTTAGGITRSGAGMIGREDEEIDVYCNNLNNVPPNDGSNVFIRTRSASVPDIMLPQLSQGHLDNWAAKAQQESVNNQMESHGNQANLESVDNDPNTYTTMQPPNTASPQRNKAIAAGDTSPYYKYFGDTNVPSPKGTGDTQLNIGGYSFGAWGSISGITPSFGPEGISSYPVGVHDDFAYRRMDTSDNPEQWSGILFISGTVFVDGPVSFKGDTEYIGNGTIVANGDITVDGNLRPYGGTVHQGVENGWALGLVTPGDLNFVGHGESSAGNPGPGIREVLRPSYSGAFYAEGTARFPLNNSSFFGTMLIGEMNFEKNGNLIVTNPDLPSYLPESLPGGDSSLVLPTLWTRD